MKVVEKQLALEIRQLMLTA